MLETVLGLFLLLGVFTFTVTMYSQSLVYLTKIERNSLAVGFADNLLTKVTAWAKDPRQFEASPWAPFLRYTDPDFPGFEGRVAEMKAAHLVPCSEQERHRDPAGQVLISDSVKRVEIEIFWEGQSLFSVYSLLPEPRREVDRVDVTPLTVPLTPLPIDGDLKFQAHAYDADGDEISDLKFFWSVEAMTGNATVTTKQRDGRRATLTNVYVLPPGVNVYTGGTCRVVASAKYFGQEYMGQSGPISLERSP